MVDLREVDFTSAASYLVNKKSVGKLLKLLDAEIAEGIRLPIDDFYRLQAQMGVIRVSCVFPFITAVRVEHALDSTIRAQPDITRRFTARNLVRYSFFIDCDWNEMNRLMGAHIPLLGTEDISIFRHWHAY